MRRSTFLKNMFAASVFATLPENFFAAENGTGAISRIDRRAVVSRHNPTVTRFSEKEIMQVGNGEIAFGIDASGLQTFHGLTMSHWGWHNVPPPVENPHGAFKMTPLDFYGRPLPYRLFALGNEPLQKQLYNWIRENPHRFNLGRLGFIFQKSDGKNATAADFKNLEQKLDLWSGVITSTYEIEGVPVHVETTCNADSAMLCVRVKTPLITQGKLKIEWSFPYGHHGEKGGVWNAPEKHHTKFSHYTVGTRSDIPPIPRQAQIGQGGEYSEGGVSGFFAQRKMDDVNYTAYLRVESDCAFENDTAHTAIITPLRNNEQCEFAVYYDAGGTRKKEFRRVFGNGTGAYFDAAIEHRKKFWQSGGAIDLSESSDPRWHELERRVVLSQYLLATQESGSLPPQESGLYNNGWNGKFHTEMYFWHGAHYALWNRFSQLEPSLKFYETALPAARKLAQTQGFKGARWPKMIGPDFEDAPSGTGPTLIWQQPHPMVFAELEYRLKPTAQTLEKWSEILNDTAEFMADFAHFNKETGYYDLGPPMKTVPENTNEKSTKNPAFELCYWRVGLRLAQTWRERRGLARVKKWDEVLKKMAPLPVLDGVYLQQEKMNDTFTKMNWEHPSLIGPNGVLPADGTDRKIAKNTVEKVWQTWQWDRCWGWDFPMFAMAAAKNGRPDLTVEILLHKSPKNAMNVLGLSSEPFPYFPSNGGLLYAIALMCAGWDGNVNRDGTVAPGFPQNGTWRVRWENLAPAL